MLMTRLTATSLKALWASKKEDAYAFAVLAGAPLLLIVAAPYCC